MSSSKWHYSCFVRLNFQVVLLYRIDRRRRKTNTLLCRADRISSWRLYLTLWRTLCFFFLLQNILFTLSMIVQCFLFVCLPTLITLRFLLMVSNKMWIAFTTKPDRNVEKKSVNRTVGHTHTHEQTENSKLAMAKKMFTNKYFHLLALNPMVENNVRNENQIENIRQLVLRIQQKTDWNGCERGIWETEKWLPTPNENRCNVEVCRMSIKFRNMISTANWSSKIP